MIYSDCSSFSNGLLLKLFDTGYLLFLSTLVDFGSSYSDSRLLNKFLGAADLLSRDLLGFLWSNSIKSSNKSSKSLLLLLVGLESGCFGGAFGYFLVSFLNGMYSTSYFQSDY